MLIKIFFAFETLASAELLEVARSENLFLVGVLCQVFLPLRYVVM